MDSLTLNINRDELTALMRDFYLLTGIKIALFEPDGKEILSYPENHCAFCAGIRSTEEGLIKCIESNRNSFNRCQKTASIEVFTCHAGLIETTAPLVDNGTVIGYIMFGQITNNPDKATLDVAYKTDSQIRAAAKILEACTFYVLLKDMVKLRRMTFINNLNAFLLEHLSEDLSVTRLTSEFCISKNKLYDSCNKYLPTGIAEHIKTLRIEEAKRLLKETTIPVAEIAGMVGFFDYNYFCRVFKKVTGMPALKYRKSFKSPV